MKTLICIGDSLTEGPDMPAGQTWPELVGNALDVDVVNCGIGGDTTAGMLARFHPAVTVPKPTFVLIMGGTNDLWWGLEINVILANLFSMVVQARHHGIAPVLALPLPVNIDLAGSSDFSPPLGGYDCFNDRLQELIRRIPRHATESEAALVDLYRPFVSQDGKINSSLYQPDGLHPNKKGHQTIAADVAQAFYQNFLFRT